MGRARGLGLQPLGTVLMAICALCCGNVPTASACDAADPFIGQICWVAFTYAPRNWAFCDGQLMQISENPA
ncbi:hypothetical protein KFL_006100070 [Klebsormidium nitens]|uniref:Phage tail collar domain-containing protein n=1 Tax=Klebsormidium nitens TaxID=105231 RepID=A0A1Y1IL70_KLENI|nr:hypothetical protein KFL_006100070 [Klebsormidium nitens]|eukprot:GAQ90189.1 hypothetical protein KFL_006100070 [Klebsormidium nitens]